ncbi:MAG: GtrA family protein [Lentisphaeria bacterium]|nr:GtrA family protein [Lentisphaeria bacterium]
MNLFQLHRKPELRRIIRYLLVGGWNTLFGVGLFTGLYQLWGTPRNYLLIAIPVNIIAVTNAFFCYKWIVFRTRGNYLREYLRCWTVYGSSTLLGMALLVLLVELFRMNPVRANILLTAFGVTWSYLGHRFFSFRHTGAGAAPRE